MEDKDANDRLEPTDLNIMATLDIEGNEGEMLEQCTKSETRSEQKEDYKLQITHHFELHAHHEE